MSGAGSNLTSRHGSSNPKLNPNPVLNNKQLFMIMSNFMWCFVPCPVTMWEVASDS